LTRRLYFSPRPPSWAPCARSLAAPWRQRSPRRPTKTSPNRAWRTSAPTFGKPCSPIDAILRLRRSGMVFGQANIIAMTVVTAGWAAVTLQSVLHKRPQPQPARVMFTPHDRRSLLYLLIQIAAIAVVYFGPTPVMDDFGNGASLIEAGTVTLLVVA